MLKCLSEGFPESVSLSEMEPIQSQSFGYGAIQVSWGHFGGGRFGIYPSALEAPACAPLVPLL